VGLTEQCVRNCSFIAGEAASAFALLTLIVLIKPKHSNLYLIAIGALAAALWFAKVLHGAHFLSEVIIASNLMLLFAVLLWRFFSLNAPQNDVICAGN
jgi:membrane-associated PAP2 superfamily phosphatase